MKNSNSKTILTAEQLEIKERIISIISKLRYSRWGDNHQGYTTNLNYTHGEFDITPETIDSFAMPIKNISDTQIAEHKEKQVTVFVGSQWLDGDQIQNYYKKHYEMSVLLSRFMQLSYR